MLRCAASINACGGSFGCCFGQVVNDEMCEQRLWKYKRRGINHFHMLEITRDVVIDAGMVGGRARFINHSCEYVEQPPGMPYPSAFISFLLQPQLHSN